MTIALRKLAMLEKDMVKREEEAQIQGYTSCPIDKELLGKISKLMDKVRNI